MSGKLNKDKILIVGAGEAGNIILSEYIRKNRKEEIIGFIDDDISKIGSLIEGIAVLAGRDKLPAIINQHHINQVIIALPSVQAEIINKTVSAVISVNPEIQIRILPKITKYFSSFLSRELEDIYLADIIDRSETELDIEAIEHSFADKTVLVTGAGGSIGSEICRQLLRFNIKRLICIGRGENSIYNLVKSLNGLAEGKCDLVLRIIDVKDHSLLQDIFKRYRPDIVFHAAAHKHVPLMEFNEIEAIQNNVGGTVNLLGLASEYKAEKFVLISTDKAVRPVNIMGATKRIAEIITDYYHKEMGLKTAIVRFGNVLGSRGSVIPLFREQIEKGGPVTITHPEVMRYFMSIPEASLLVINAASYSNGGECFMLDMGKQYRILDIAHRLIRLYGHEPDKEIKISFTGLRPGEKLSEELTYEKENMRKTDNEKIFVINAPDNGAGKNTVKDLIEKKLPGVKGYSPEKIRELIKSVIPEYDYSNYETSVKYSGNFRRVVS